MTSAANKTLKLGDGDVSDGLNAAFAGVLAYARARAATLEDDPETAVHEFRKSVRRARSLVRFAEGILGRKRAKKLQKQLKRAFEPTSALRDGDVMGPVLLAMLDGRPELAEAGRRVADRIEGERAGRQGAPIGAVLTQSVADLEGVEARFAAAVPSTMTEQDLWDALDVRRQATAARRAEAAADDDPELVHEWRKRTKELRYSLELLAAQLDSEGQAEHVAAAALAKELGEIADLLALAAYVGDEEPLLSDAIGAEIVTRRAGVLQLGA